jgi:hypothetical protein
MEAAVSWFESLRHAAAPVIDHSAFGPLRASVCEGDDRWLWEALDLLPTERGRVDLAFEAGPDGPGAAQQAQLEAIVANLDVLTRAAAPKIFARLAGSLDRPVAGDPWAELEWQGAQLTDRDGDFRLHYSCKSWPDAMISVHFERVKPTLVQIDD